MAVSTPEIDAAVERIATLWNLSLGPLETIRSELLSAEQRGADMIAREIRHDCAIVDTRLLAAAQRARAILGRMADKGEAEWVWMDDVRDFLRELAGE